MPYNVVGDFARLPAREYPIADHAVHLSADRDIGNVFLRWPKLERELGAALDPLSRDLCEIATYVYLADKALPRGGFDDWARHLSFLIPVRRPGTWNALKPFLMNTVATLTGDSVRFRFVKAVERDGREAGNRRQPEPGPSAGAADCVSLFSGGLDSYSGAIHLLRQGRRPALVSHFANPSLRLQQVNLRGGLETRFGTTCEHLQYRITTRKTARTAHQFKQRESSHRARSFLFLSFAAVVAATRGLREIFICENGVLALNVAISEARRGTRCSRHAHPQYLRYFRQLIEELYGKSFAISNPFLFWTKREEVELIVQAGLGSAVADTVSCWNFPNYTLRYKGANHCGFCIPCIVRRLSVLAAAGSPRDDGYVHDLLAAEASDHPDLRRNLRDIAFFCRCLSRESATRLLYRYPDLIGIESTNGTGPGDRVKEIIKVYKRFARDTIRALQGPEPG